MEKLSIQQASEQFNISRARLYQLLEKGAVVGHKSTEKGRRAGSWVHLESLREHIENRNNKKGGRNKVEGYGNYLPVRIAAEKTGYSIRQINHLAKQGRILAKKMGDVNLILYSTLLNYMNK